MQRWQGLVAEFTGGNPEIQQGLNKMYAQEQSLQQMTGIDPELSAYVGKARAAGKQ
jgi:hypothetical protein